MKLGSKKVIFSIRAWKVYKLSGKAPEKASNISTFIPFVLPYQDAFKFDNNNSSSEDESTASHYSTAAVHIISLISLHFSVKSH